MPSNYTADLIVRIIKDYLDNLRVCSRDVLIYGYPTADCTDKRNKCETYYPRSADELLQIERCLGPVRFVSILNTTEVPYKIEDEKIELEKPVVEKKVKEGEDEDEEPKQDEEEDKDKPKFSIFDYAWT